MAATSDARRDDAPAIPAVAHFIWLGTRVPWLFVLAVRAACRNGGFRQVVFHHVDRLDAATQEAAAQAGVATCFRRLDTEALFAALGELGPPLREVYARLRQPAAQANVLRLAVLARDGGVYLDTDVLTVRPFTPLLARGFFCGEEHLVLPARLLASRNPLRWLAAGLRLVVRDLCRRAPRGHRTFARLAAFYPRAANNAVLGAAPAHPFVLGLLRAIVDMPVEKQTVRFALGTHLLESALASPLASHLKRGESVLPPATFYPLAPELSAHWFRVHRSGARLDEVLGPETLAVHWYASVRTRHLQEVVDAAYLRVHAERQLFSALASRLLVDEDLGGAPGEELAS